MGDILRGAVGALGGGALDCVLDAILDGALGGGPLGGALSGGPLGDSTLGCATGTPGSASATPISKPVLRLNAAQTSSTDQMCSMTFFAQYFLGSPRL